jgi:alanine transaminase
MPFREDIASFIKERDGLEANPDNIFMTNGASAGIGMILQCLIANDKW